MRVDLPTKGLEDYKSKSQRARIATEGWALKNLYCPNCDNVSLVPTPANTSAVDYSCENCREPFQLKSQSHAFAGRIIDAAYSAMVRAIRENRTPNLFVLHYEPVSWKVQNLIVIPQFAFPLSAIERRKPLAPTAHRAGWVGCNILLDAIPPDAKIPVICAGRPSAPHYVRERFARIRPIAKLKPEQRGWMLDVLNGIRRLNKKEFSLAEAYKLEGDLARLYPHNQHVRPKIRQQLQIIRDLGLLEFLGGGTYRIL